MNFAAKVLLLICLSLMALGGCARKTSRTTKVTVAGEATSRVEPDTATLTISVITQSAQALNAQQENARKSKAVSDAVKALAPSAEIKTSDYTLQPQYDYRDNKLPKITGYNARNSVIVAMTDLQNVGAVIDAASKAGANSIDGIAFTLKQTSPARGQALADATQQAMNKANSIAQALGGRVARVVEENEASTVNGSGYNQYLYDRNGNMNSARASASALATPVEGGPLNIKANVQLIVEIEG
ncbi:MAG TPA: SIMPL domain-containing protein [Pyrinomonadaceae bacterium]|nr:SIMPL domain-containing protein [Pyrinomonadaceae bacterium]